MSTTVDSQSTPSGLAREETDGPKSPASVDESLQLSIYALACRDALGLETRGRVTLYSEPGEGMRAMRLPRDVPGHGVIRKSMGISRTGGDRRTLVPNWLRHGERGGA